MAKPGHLKSAGPTTMKLPGRFFLYFAIFFVVLAWPWPGLRATVQAVFRAEIRVVLPILFGGQELHVVDFPDARHPRLDTAVTTSVPRATGSREPQTLLEIPFDSVSQGYIPLAMLFALFLATPAPWSNRWRALLAGLILVELLAVSTIWVGVAYGLADSQIPNDQKLWLVCAHRLLVENIWFAFLPPVLWWIGWLACGSHPWVLGKEDPAAALMSNT